MDPNEAGAPGPEVALPEGEEEAPRGVRAAAIVRWAIVAVVALVAAVTIGRALLAPAVDHRTSGTVYTCPMHPEIVRDAPGACPICGMDLVPRSAATPSHVDHAAGDGGVPGLVPVELSTERRQASGIRTVRAVAKTLGAEVRAAGSLAADERGMAEVTARVSGWLGAGRAVAVGDRVRRGQLLGTIDSPEVLAAARELLSVRGLGRAQGVTGLDLASPIRQKLELLGVPLAQIQRIERSGQASGLVPISAPAAGHIVGRAALPGSYVDRGTALYQIADLSSVWALVEVYPEDLPRIEVGQVAAVQVEGHDGPAAEGRVGYVYPTSDPGTRTTRVRIDLPNPDLRLRPGLFADVRVRTGEVMGVVVPREAVVDTGDVTYVFVAQSGGRFEPRRVTLGVRAGDEIVVTEGLAAGEEVVSSSSFLLDSESRLRAAVQRRAP
jgi:membrane fusion protein, copper/silver efflux system